MSLDFSATDERVDDTTHLVAVEGEVDIFTAPEFKARVADAIDTARGVVVVDLTQTTFMDSSSLGVLISAHRRLAERGGRLIVACDVPAVLKTLRITGLDTVLEVASDRAAALAAASGDAVG